MAGIGARLRQAPAGRRLPPGVRARLESGLAADLRAVRVHDDDNADGLARDLGARAFTAGTDIYFRRGAYAPLSRHGLEVLAHEAVHAVQQSAGRVASTAGPAGVRVSDPLDRFERQASRIATRIASPGGGGDVGCLPGRAGVVGGRSPARAAAGGDVAVQRWVNEDFGPHKPAGIPTKPQLTKATAFAKKVGAFAEQARKELLSGHVEKWGKAGPYDAKGARWLPFAKLLSEGRDDWALTHVGNVIEERVYQLMHEAGMALKWDSQVTFGTSKPDIVVELGDGRYAAIDITSNLAHVLTKPGLWSDSSIVYVAEAMYDSVTADLLDKAKPAILSGKAMSAKELGKLEKKVAAQAKAKQLAATKERQKRLGEFLAYGTMSAFAKDPQFGDSLTKASAYLREVGIEKKGMTKRPGVKRQGGLDVAAAAAKLAKARQAQSKIKREKAVTSKRKDVKAKA
jgi:hypothetical protein